MDIVRDAASSHGAHVVTIGAYDGVHIGHQMIIKATREAADGYGVKTAVLTFDPHPAYITRPDMAPKLLTSLDLKLELLEAAGVDTVMVLSFDRQAATEAAQSFVERVLVGALQARAVVVGENFHFGRDREGNLELLSKLGQAHQFEVHGLRLAPQPGDQSKVVSSTSIRAAVSKGDVERAAQMLGRHHQISGVVVHGDERGRTIGFPTANVDVGPEIALPQDGVYAAWFVLANGGRWPAAVNVGRRPTFYADAERSLTEAHLIGFEGDLYGQLVRVEFVARIRAEKAFSGIEALVTQLASDVRDAESTLLGSK